MIMTLQEIAVRVNGQLQGDAGVEISGVNNISGAQPGDITFADENHVSEAAGCRAGAVLLPKSVAEAQKGFPLPVVFVEDTRAAFAILLMAFTPPIVHEKGVSPEAHIGKDVKIGENVTIMPMAFVDDYATNETENYMPLSLDLSHKLLMILADIRREGKEMTYLRPDSKSQVTIEYDDNGKPVRIDTIVVSTQHDEFILPADKSKEAQLKADEEMLAIIRKDVIEVLMPRVIASIHNPEVLKLFNDQITYHVNPTGKFVIGGPHGDTGLTGRKIIVDTYGGKGAHGGGAFSGKDPSKVDRSAAYAARHIAKNLVAAGVADEILVQVSYAIGVARPVSIYVNTYGRSNVNMTDGEIAKKIDELFDLRPKAIEERLKLRNPIYEETASYGHMGREPKVVTKTYESMYRETKTVEVELFTWEKLDYVEKVKEAFGL